VNGPQIAFLPDGRRLHLHYGPIDLIVEAFGPDGECQKAYRRAAERFDGLLEELVAELPALRSGAGAPVTGPIARRMVHAVAPHRPAFITPMAAVAGAVADEILAAMVASGSLSRAYVNNGGDIALHLAPGESLRAALANSATIADRVRINHEDPARGIATSGWRGRSWSLGIADAVTVLARDAAAADAAATLIANAVDLPCHPAIARRPADALQPDTDLGSRPVTIAVGPLSPAEIATALDAGLRRAGDMLQNGLICAAALYLAGGIRLCGTLFLEHSPEKEPAYG